MFVYELENGKYKVINDNGIVTVKRHGEDWGYEVDKFTLCLIQEIERLSDKLDDIYFEMSTRD